MAAGRNAKTIMQIELCKIMDAIGLMRQDTATQTGRVFFHVSAAPQNELRQHWSALSILKLCHSKQGPSFASSRTSGRQQEFRLINSSWIAKSRLWIKLGIAIAQLQLSETLQMIRRPLQYFHQLARPQTPEALSSQGKMKESLVTSNE